MDYRVKTEEMSLFLFSSYNFGNTYGRLDIGKRCWCAPKLVVCFSRNCCKPFDHWRFLSEAIRNWIQEVLSIMDKHLRYSCSMWMYVDLRNNVHIYINWSDHTWRSHRGDVLHPLVHASILKDNFVK